MMRSLVLLSLLALAATPSCSAADDPMSFRELADVPPPPNAPDLSDHSESSGAPDITPIDGGGDCDCEDCTSPVGCWTFSRSEGIVTLVIFTDAIPIEDLKEPYIEILAAHSRTIHVPISSAYEDCPSNPSCMTGRPRTIIHGSLEDGALALPPMANTNDKGPIDISDLDAFDFTQVAEAVDLADELDFSGVAMLPRDSSSQDAPTE